MNNYSIKVIDSNSIQVKVTRKQKVIRSIKIRVGQQYLVEPDNPKKLKHRGRICTVTNFILDSYSNPLTTKVYFHDTKKKGNVSIEDLVECENIEQKVALN